MSRFIAIPVAQGDAFYLKRDDSSVLVDGGRSRSGFPQMFRAATQADGVNVVVCTHNDADHANGILGFLEAGLRCEEVWLPGRWLATLPDVLKPFADVFLELANNVVAEKEVLSNTEEWPAGLSPLEAYEETMRGRQPDERRERNDGPSVGEDGWPESYVQMLERAERWGVFPWWPAEDWRILPYGHYQKLGAAAVRLLWSAIDAASRIRAIASEAFHRGILVRWFEFDAAKPPLGGIMALKPVNARQVARVRPRVGPLLWALALTVSNKESLVFWSPPTKQHPGVLFTADSDLAGVSLPSQLQRALATAPHHGSEANANAYKALEDKAPQHSPSITWVRSDGRYRTRPGRTYLGLSSRRLCTLCRLGASRSTTKQAVHLFSRAAVWTRHRATVECSCQ